MCLQCIVKAHPVAHDVLPGISLFLSTEDGSKEWPKDWYGLVATNDPLLVFPGPLLVDPCHGMTEDDLDPMPEYPEGYEEYRAGCQALGPHLKAFLHVGHRLVNLCQSQGYDPVKHGELQWWLMHHLASRVA